jgi:fructan beta-fructosidase
MTIPRDLGLEKIGDKYLLTSHPVDELSKIQETAINFSNINASSEKIANSIGSFSAPARIEFISDNLQPFTITLSNDLGEKVVIGYDKATNNYFIDRTSSGKIDFEKGFAAKHIAPRLTTRSGSDLTLIIDVASVELFADNGLTAMSQIFFPNAPFSRLDIRAEDTLIFKSFRYQTMKSIW